MLTPIDFISQCRTCIASGGAPSDIASIVREALASQAAEPSLWTVDELMFRSEELLIVNLTLAPFTVSPVHDHGVWAVIGISNGCEIEHFFEPTDNRLRAKGDLVVTSGQAVILPAETIHAISNPLASTTRGLHVYGKDLVSAKRHMWDPETGAQWDFDMTTFERWQDQLTSKAKSAHWTW